MAAMQSPTIATVLAQFLAEQEQRLSPRTYAQYDDVVELLQHCLNGYASQSLTELDTKRFDRLYNARGDAHREFCEIFGPEHILSNLGEFLGYFMVRKVVADRGLLRAAGTVTKRLAVWLAEKGYVEPGQAEFAAKRGADAARDLPKAEELASGLAVLAETEGGRKAAEQTEDHFQITRVEPGRIWLEGLLDGHERGPIQLPKGLSRLCQPGWAISGVVGRVGKRWRFLEVWNVYPH
jgi:hypothetical protein